MLPVILNYTPRHPERPALSSRTSRQVILNDPPRHCEVDSESVLRKPRFRIESGMNGDKRAQIPGQARMTEEG